MKNKLTAICLFFCFVFGACQQDPLEEKSKAADELLRPYDGSGPGYAIGIIKDGKLIFSKGYGYANLEYKIPMSPDSPFYIGSMSKQFTAACILLLQEQGKLNFSDPVRKYLPELPNYGKPITIEHLLHHTSGIKESYSLMLFTGGNPRWEDYFDNDDMCRLMYDQRSLNFAPGEQYRYSSGGYILLTKIIEKVSGRPLSAFADENLFRPLGMSHTFFNDNYAEIVPDRVESYRKVKRGYERYNKNFDTYGDGGIITTVKDLLKWDTAFYSDKLGIENFAQKMYAQGALSNGKAIDYAKAVQIGEYNGRKTIGHNGGMLGFMVDMVRFPDQKFTAIVMGNGAAGFPTFMAHRLSDIYLGKPSAPGPKVNAVAPVSSPKMSRNAMKKLSGNYWNVAQNYYNTIDFRNDTLFFNNTNGGVIPLRAIAQDSFALLDTDMKVRFMLEKGEPHMRLHRPSENNAVALFRKYIPEPPSKIEELKKFAGNYYSDELKTTYRFEIEKGSFYWKINNHKRKQLYPPVGNVIWNSGTMVWIGFGEIMFQTDIEGEITGLVIGDSRVSGVAFKKE